MSCRDYTGFTAVTECAGCALTCPLCSQRVPAPSTLVTAMLSVAGTRWEHKSGVIFASIGEICGLRPVTDFDLNQNQKGDRPIRRPSCSKCRLDIDRRYISARVRKPAKQKKPPDKSVWRCPICEKQTIVGVTAKRVLDRDHRSGLTRGYICDSCNTGLGRFRNGKIYLQNAIAWLEETERQALVSWTEEEKQRSKSKQKSGTPID